MFGTYAATAFELEAERRHEVVEASMRDVRRNMRSAERESRRSERSPWAVLAHGLAHIAAGFAGRVGLRA